MEPTIYRLNNRNQSAYRLDNMEPVYTQAKTWNQFTYTVQAQHGTSLHAGSTTWNQSKYICNNMEPAYVRA